MNKTIDVIIARRSYFEVGGKNESPVLQAELGAPVLSRSEPEEYMCSFRITSSESEHIETAYGIDELQALQLALRGLKVSLQLFSDSSRNGIRWAGSKIADIGIGLPDL